MIVALSEWLLVADIGGTNARFGIVECSSFSLVDTRHYSVDDNSSFDGVLAEFMDEVIDAGVWSSMPSGACFAVASPVGKDAIKFTNSAWRISTSRLSTMLGDCQVSLINDFAAVGYAVASLEVQDCVQVCGGTAINNRPIAILGPGTGLGVCSVFPVASDDQTDPNYIVVEGEGGHVDFAPVDENQARVCEVMRQWYGRVSAERFLSGAGIFNIYRALCQLNDTEVVFLSPSEVAHAAQLDKDETATNALTMFFNALGSFAGNLVLTTGAQGGVYIAGGVVPKCIDFFEKSEFKDYFEKKGRFHHYMSDIPVRVIIKKNLGLIGASAFLRSCAL